MTNALSCTLVPQKNINNNEKFKNSSDRISFESILVLVHSASRNICEKCTQLRKGKEKQMNCKIKI